MENYNTSKTLLMQVRDQGDEVAWRRFSETYSPFIYALLKKYDLNYEDREELCQDVLVKVWKALGNFLYERERCRFRTWLGRICKNTALNFINLKRNRQARQNIDDGETVILSLSCKAETEEMAEREWRLFVAAKAWENIQPLFKEKHLQAYSLMMEGKSASEVAQVCSIEENTAYVYRKKVQTSMGREIKRLNMELDG